MRPELNGSLFFLAAFIVVLGAVEAACADHRTVGAPTRDSYDTASFSSWACYGISRELFELAANLHYSPESRDGKIVFCRAGEQISSIVSKEHCVDTTTLSSGVLQPVGAEAHAGAHPDHRDGTR